MGGSGRNSLLQRIFQGRPLEQHGCGLLNPSSSCFRCFENKECVCVCKIRVKIFVGKISKKFRLFFDFFASGLVANSTQDFFTLQRCENYEKNYVK